MLILYIRNPRDYRLFLVSASSNSLYLTVKANILRFFYFISEHRACLNGHKGRCWLQGPHSAGPGGRAHTASLPFSLKWGFLCFITVVYIVKLISQTHEHSTHAGGSVAIDSFVRPSGAPTGLGSWAVACFLSVPLSIKSANSWIMCLMFLLVQCASI